MKSKKKYFTAFILWVLLLVIPVFGVGAAKIDSGLIDMAFDKLEGLDERMKSDAIEMLREYFKNENSLDSLKEDVTGILKMVAGDDYEEKLKQKGLSISEIKSEIDNLKAWSPEDRMKLLDAIQQGDKDEVTDLLEKYGEIDGTAKDGTVEGGSSPGAGTGVGALPGPGVPVQNSLVFKDIENHWARPYILFLAEKGIVKGKKEGVFAPGERITRAEFIAMLARLLALAPGESVALPFVDVPEGAWYAGVVKAAYASGLARGRGDRFEPDSLITREEMVTLAIRAASMKNKSANVNSDEIEKLLSHFKDKDKISSWAKTEVAVALKLGLAKGVGQDLFAPRAGADRAQAAAVIYNLYKAVSGE
jgi:hypothetical protein